MFLLTRLYLGDGDAADHTGLHPYVSACEALTQKTRMHMLRLCECPVFVWVHVNSVFFVFIRACA